MSKPVPAAVCQGFALDLRRAQAEYLGGAGGFSGAWLWRLTIPGENHSGLPGEQASQEALPRQSGTGESLPQVLCLRRWPAEHPDEARLQLIHGVLRHAAKNGIDFVPAPLPTARGQSYLRHQGHLWELTPWMPGRADYFPLRNPAKLQASLQALARFHLAVADYPHAGRGSAPRPSPGIAARLLQLRQWPAQRRAEVLRKIQSNQQWPALNPAAAEVLRWFERLAPSAEQCLLGAAELEIPLQPAIRDIWSDHVLLTGERVTGIVDFGSLNIESPAADVARLLGSMAEDDAQAWQLGLAAYERVRPLSETERRLVRAFDESTVALAGLNWLQWLYVEGRQFEDAEAIAGRLQSIAARMRRRA